VVQSGGQPFIGPFINARPSKARPNVKPADIDRG
jgi:hypothetical protein